MSTSAKIRLVIVDDHPVVREGLRSMVLRAPGMDLVSVCGSGEAALKIAQRVRVDIMLIDMRMSPMNGVELLRRLKTVSPQCKGLILSSYHFEEEIFQAVMAGASGYISKDALPDEILRQIHAAYAGEQLFSPELLQRVEQRSKRRSLSSREMEILEMVAKGLTNKEIAGVLGSSQFTVRNQLRSLSAKLDASDRTEAARIAIEQGIILV
jgi:DNA-binding NarL/FixJ family response regulator